MKKLTFLALLSVFLALPVTGCANMGQPINLELAERNKVLVDQTTADNDFLRGALTKTLGGDTSWNKDAQGSPVFDDNISKSMGVRNDAGKKTAQEVLDNAKLNNPGK